MRMARKEVGELGDIRKIPSQMHIMLVVIEPQDAHDLSMAMQQPCV